MKEINKDVLKVGDTIGIQATPYFYDHGYFKYPKTTKAIIKEISPDRDTFTIENGLKWDKSEPFYQITEETERQNKVVDCAEDIEYYLHNLETFHGKFFCKNDDFIIKAAGVLKKLYEELFDETEEGEK